jgi:hypothetical protein
LIGLQGQDETVLAALSIALNHVAFADECVGLLPGGENAKPGLVIQAGLELEAALVTTAKPFLKDEAMTSVRTLGGGDGGERQAHETPQEVLRLPANQDGDGRGAHVLAVDCLLQVAAI